MEKSYLRLLENNKNWVREQLELDPDFFERLSRGQSPDYLWIGCSDSRCLQTKLLGQIQVKYLYTEILPIWWYIVI